MPSSAGEAELQNLGGQSFIWLFFCNSSWCPLSILLYLLAVLLCTGTFRCPPPLPQLSGPALPAPQTMRQTFSHSVGCKTSFLCVSPSNQFSCEGFSGSEDHEILGSLWSESIATEQEAASWMRCEITQNFFKNFCLLLGNKLLYLKSTQTFHVSKQHKTEYVLSQNIPGVPGCQLPLIASRQISCLEPWTAKEVTWV